MTAQGMQVFLAVDSTPPDDNRRAAPSKSNAVSGVRRVILPTNVNMNLWAEGSGFMGGSKPANPPPPDAKAERTNLQITTIGPFTYDVLPDGDHARFDQLPPSATPLPNSVRAVRPQKRGANSIVNDQLECDHLELKFATEALPSIVGDPQSKPAPPKSKTDPDKPQIEWIHAWGQYVVLTSDEEKLEARGTELYHDAIAKTTTLTGVPETVALKDGNEIHAPKLVMYSPTIRRVSTPRRLAPAISACSIAPATSAPCTPGGKIARLSKRGESRSAHARGNAMFEDKAGGQTLTADTLKLLLTPDNKNGPKVQPANAPPPRPKPQRLEGYGHVTVFTPDLKGRDIEELIVYFQDVALRPLRHAAAERRSAADRGAANVAVRCSADAEFPARFAKPSDPTKAKNPIDLRARRVQAFLLTGPGDQTELDHVDCEGDVPSIRRRAAQTKPIDMAGTGSSSAALAEGNILEAEGPLECPRPRDAARTRTDRPFHQNRPGRKLGRRAGHRQHADRKPDRHAGQEARQARPVDRVLEAEDALQRPGGAVSRPRAGRSSRHQFALQQHAGVSE